MEKKIIYKPTEIGHINMLPSDPTESLDESSLQKRKVFKFKKTHYISNLRIASMIPSNLKRLLDVFDINSGSFEGGLSWKIL